MHTGLVLGGKSDAGVRSSASQVVLIPSNGLAVDLKVNLTTETDPETSSVRGFYHIMKLENLLKLVASLVKDVQNDLGLVRVGDTDAVGAIATGTALVALKVLAGIARKLEAKLLKGLVDRLLAIGGVGGHGEVLNLDLFGLDARGSGKGSKGKSENGGGIHLDSGLLVLTRDCCKRVKVWLLM